MDFESDPAAEFLSREREELGDLEGEIIASNGKFVELSFVFLIAIMSGFQLNQLWSNCRVMTSR